MDRRIDFLIVGAQKAGTTALFEFLGQHPNIFMPAVKEVHFFLRDEFYRQGHRYLDPLYRRAQGETLLGAADVELMYFSHVARRVHAYHPGIRLLAVLRNPIDRAYSAYWFARRLGFETAETFEEALAREPSRAAGDYIERSKLTYLGHGHYAEQLSAFLQWFDRDQLYVLFSTDLGREPSAALESVFRWLGVSPDLQGVDWNRRVNVAGMPRSLLLQRLLRSDESTAKRILRKLIPHGVRHFVRRRVRAPLLARNIRPFSYPPMRQETRASLRRYYSPHNERLAELLQVDLDRWDGEPV